MTSIPTAAQEAIFAAIEQAWDNPLTAETTVRGGRRGNGTPAAIGADMAEWLNEPQARASSAVAGILDRAFNKAQVAALSADRGLPTDGTKGAMVSNLSWTVVEELLG